MKNIIKTDDVSNKDGVISYLIQEYEKISNGLNIKLENNIWNFTNVQIIDNKENGKSKFVLYCKTQKFNLDVDLLLKYNSKNYNYKLVFKSNSI
ncbi:hypothetical protein [Spiroplasma endosymbiont of Sarcophaga variegata]|uniref:hypothetical protein n=2 Tax=unclassified Spiroplasma TaxID=2637901 RepID=UPI003AF826AD